jgi:hypothetical protein
MKPNWTFVTGVIGGGFVVFLSCWLYQSARSAALQAQIDSDIKRPVEVMLTDIAKTSDENADLSLKKLRLMEQLWREYRKGGDPPESFVNTVTALRDNQPQ